jgi:hypothetical protein
MSALLNMQQARVDAFCAAWCEASMENNHTIESRMLERLWNIEQAILSKMENDASIERAIIEGIGQ